MQTTLRLSDDLYRRAKSKAADMGISLTRFLEESLERRLDELNAANAGRQVQIPVAHDMGPPPASAHAFRQVLDDEQEAADREKLSRSRT